nr:PEP-CTERM sorting domain-containing protein [Marinobacter sp. F4216]
MELKNLVMGAGFAVASLTATSASALPYISGQIGFTGGYYVTDSTGTVVSDQLAAGDRLSFFGVTVLGEPPGKNIVTTGDYDGTEGTAVTMSDIVYDPFYSLVNPLWSFTLAGVTYEFEMLNLTAEFQNATDLELDGKGLLKITGFEDTQGYWSFSNQSGFTFSASSAVPEPGTLALLGLGLAGLGVARRRQTEA